MNKSGSKLFSKYHLSVIALAFVLGATGSACVLLKSNQVELINKGLITACFLLLITSLFMAFLIFRLKNESTPSINQETKNTAPTDLLNEQAMRVLAQTMINLHTRLDQKLCFFIAGIDHKEGLDSQQEKNDILSTVSLHFSGSLRETDIVSLNGDSEFIIILPNTGTDEGYRLAEGIRERVAGLDINGLKTTISIGCVVLRKGENYRDIVKRAKDALACAKQGGRNRTVVA